MYEYYKNILNFILEDIRILYLKWEFFRVDLEPEKILRSNCINTVFIICLLKSVSLHIYCRVHFLKK
jgi:hypothetical protein